MWSVYSQVPGCSLGTDAAQLAELLAKMMCGMGFAVIVLGLMWQFWGAGKSGDAIPLFEEIVKITLIVVVALFFPYGIDFFQNLFSSVHSSYEQEVDKLLVNSVRSIKTKSEAGGSYSSMEIVMPLGDELCKMGKRIMLAIGKAVRALMKWVQQYFLIFTKCLSPLVCAFLAFRPIASLGQKFLMFNASILLWYFGFMFADIVIMEAGDKILVLIIAAAAGSGATTAASITMASIASGAAVSAGAMAFPVVLAFFGTLLMMIIVFHVGIPLAITAMMLGGNPIQGFSQAASFGSKAMGMGANAFLGGSVLGRGAMNAMMPRILPNTPQSKSGNALNAAGTPPLLNSSSTSLAGSSSNMSGSATSFPALSSGTRPGGVPLLPSTTPSPMASSITNSPALPLLGTGGMGSSFSSYNVPAISPMNMRGSASSLGFPMTSSLGGLKTAGASSSSSHISEPQTSGFYPPSSTSGNMSTGTSGSFATMSNSMKGQPSFGNPIGSSLGNSNNSSRDNSYSSSLGNGFKAASQPSMATSGFGARRAGSTANNSNSYSPDDSNGLASQATMPSSFNDNPQPSSRMSDDISSQSDGGGTQSPRELGSSENSGNNSSTTTNSNASSVDQTNPSSSNASSHSADLKAPAGTPNDHFIEASSGASDSSDSRLSSSSLDPDKSDRNTGSHSKNTSGNTVAGGHIGGSQNTSGNTVAGGHIGGSQNTSANDPNQLETLGSGWNTINKKWGDFNQGLAQGLNTVDFSSPDSVIGLGSKNSGGGGRAPENQSVNFDPNIGQDTIKSQNGNMPNQSGQRQAPLTDFKGNPEMPSSFPRGFENAPDNIASTKTNDVTNDVYGYNKFNPDDNAKKS